jgi:hypothetical protein
MRTTYPATLPSVQKAAGYVDYLRRCGIEVTAVAVGESMAVKGSRGIQIMADAMLKSLFRHHYIKKC